jgi:hypothetical protein
MFKSGQRHRGLEHSVSGNGQEQTNRTTNLSFVLDTTTTNLGGFPLFDALGSSGAGNSKNIIIYSFIYSFFLSFSLSRFMFSAETHLMNKTTLHRPDTNNPSAPQNNAETIR